MDRSLRLRRGSDGVRLGLRIKGMLRLARLIGTRDSGAGSILLVNFLHGCCTEDCEK